MVAKRSVDWQWFPKCNFHLVLALLQTLWELVVKCHHEIVSKLRIVKMWFQLWEEVFRVLIIMACKWKIFHFLLNSHNYGKVKLLILFNLGKIKLGILFILEIFN